MQDLSPTAHDGDTPAIEKKPPRQGMEPANGLRCMDGHCLGAQTERQGDAGRRLFCWPGGHEPADLFVRCFCVSSVLVAGHAL